VVDEHRLAAEDAPGPELDGPFTVQVKGRHAAVPILGPTD